MTFLIMATANYSYLNLLLLDYERENNIKTTF